MDQVLRAISEPRRRKILQVVWQAEVAAGDIHRQLGDVTFGAVSQHLRVLEQAQLVSMRKAGRFRYYRANQERLGPFREWLESTWDAGLARLTALAEAEAATLPEQDPPAESTSSSKTPGPRGQQRPPQEKPS